VFNLKEWIKTSLRTNKGEVGPSTRLFKNMPDPNPDPDKKLNSKPKPEKSSPPIRFSALLKNDSKSI
jgi:hypothetical protein